MIGAMGGSSIPCSSCLASPMSTLSSSLLFHHGMTKRESTHFDDLTPGAITLDRVLLFYHLSGGWLDRYLDITAKLEPMGSKGDTTGRFHPCFTQTSDSLRPGLGMIG